MNDRSSGRPDTIRLALYFHDHQPVGNFDEVFDFAFTHSYMPLLQALSKHPKIKFGIHNSGPLCDWLLKNRPGYFDLLKETVKNGQAEILVSAYSEPILSLVPRRDALDQIRYFKDYLFKLLDCEAKGFWLTERVWEPGLIQVLTDSGIEYTMLDDTHFRYAGLSDQDLYSYYITEDNGMKLKVFPISMKLRYLIPFHPIEESINYLKEESSGRGACLKTLGDDGEKFGVWPGTHDWVFGQNWLENFLQRLESEDWIESVHLKDIAAEPAAGRIYLPTASYEEMGEWALPVDAGKDYDELKRTVDRRYYHLVHGGYFKNFLAKYPEANLMHKRMLYVSRRAKNIPEARLSLWRGQCSCAYWHGIFGGLYLPHLREAIYRNLIEAESYDIRTGHEITDIDTDGEDEIVISSTHCFCVIKPRTGGFIEIDERRSVTNILNYLGRRKEKYHARISGPSEAEGIRSIHEVIKSKEKNLEQFLIYDKYPRAFGLDHDLKAAPTREDFYYQNNMGAVINYDGYDMSGIDQGRIVFMKREANLEKSVRIDDTRDHCIEFAYRGNDRMIGVEFSLGLFHANLMINGTHSLHELQDLEGLKGFTITGDNLRPIRFEASMDFKLLTYPIITISSSESGFEKNFQGFALLLVFSKLPLIRVSM
jgi:alpha-amylase/alpha-mannosidase (GH57 family)